MRFPKIYADEYGETHFGNHETSDRAIAMGPPPNPVGLMSDFGAVSTMSIFCVPAGTVAPAHNAPQPYVVIILGGEGEVITSDGESRQFKAGDLLVCSDLIGKGHVTRAITDLRLAFIHRVQS